jgi:hypothetical protein
MKAENLIKSWSLPERSAERVSVTLRLPFDVYASLHAFKEVFPEQSVNDIARDLLRAAISEVTENLPVYKIGPEEAMSLAAQQDYFGPEEFLGSDSGPKVIFESAFIRIMKDKKSSVVDIRAVQNEASGEVA